jgi:hypothetical protein
MKTDTFKSLVKFGNSKLPKSTMIFNMGSAHDCPSAKLGMCKVGADCYALKPERMYPDCRPYRERQKRYWLTTKTDDIIKEIDDVLSRKRIMPTHFRYNESGDFYSQADVYKLDTIAKHLKTKWNITTYGYSARKDLDFSRVAFLCKSSGHENGNTGTAKAAKKDSRKFNELKAAGYRVCLMDCKICGYCKKDKAINIVFPLH